jgi:FKBP-type peptidyl-prolyl cis-trans isomerase 2
LIGKEIGNYEIELSPENAFGNRNSKLVQIIPSRVFREQKVNPVSGAMFNFDGRVAKILSVSGGRIIADFNNPIAGKTVIYNVRVSRKVDDEKEKAKAFIDFLFRRHFDFEIKDKKITIKAEKDFVKFLELFKDKFKEILDLDLEIVEQEKKDSKEKPAEAS